MSSSRWSISSDDFRVNLGSSGRLSVSSVITDPAPEHNPSTMFCIASRVFCCLTSLTFICSMAVNITDIFWTARIHVALWVLCKLHRISRLVACWSQRPERCLWPAVAECLEPGVCSGTPSASPSQRVQLWSWTGSWCPVPQPCRTQGGVLASGWDHTWISPLPEHVRRSSVLPRFSKGQGAIWKGHI